MSNTIALGDLTDEDVVHLRLNIEDQWRRRAKVQGLKHGTAKYMNAEIEFFVGAMAALQAVHCTVRLTPLVPPAWSIAIMTGRCIVGKD